MRTLVLALTIALLAALAGSAGGAGNAPGRGIVFAANLRPQVVGRLIRLGLDGSTRTLAHNLVDVSPVLVSPSGTWIAYADPAGLELVRVDGTGRLRLLPSDGPDQWSIEWAPGRDELAAATPGHLFGRVVYVVSPGSKPRRVASGYLVRDPRWSTDGRSIAFSFGSNRFRDPPYTVEIVRSGGSVVWRGPKARAPAWTTSNRPVSDGTQARSRNGALVATTTRATTTGSWLEVSGRGFSHPRRLAQLRSCNNDGWTSGINYLQFTPDSRYLVYATSWCDLNADIYVVDAGGRELRRVVAGGGDKTSPAWSPDGRQIAFARADAVGLSCKGCARSLWVMNADGTHRRLLTSPPDCVYDDQPSWSPDGKQIVFVRSSCSVPSELYVVSAKGGRIRNLHVAGTSPAWGPKRIAYQHGGPKASIWTIAPDGTGARRVAVDGRWPDWLADGRLAFIGDMNTWRLPPRAQDVEWSPDGRVAAFVAPADGEQAFELFTTDGASAKQLTSGLGVYAGVSWR